MIKSRTSYPGLVSGIMRNCFFCPVNPYVNSGLQSYEWRDSVNHAKLNGRWSGGGPFYLERDMTYYSPKMQEASWYTSGGGWLGTGTTRIEGPSGVTPVSLGNPSHPSLVSRLADATSAIAAIEPTNPAFDLSVFLGELRAEGLPNLPGSSVRDKVSLANKSGSEYLNVEFGWLPLIRGIRDFAKTVNNADSILSSYREKANVVTQRSYEWPHEEQSQAYNCAQTMFPPEGFYTGGGHHEYRFVKKWLEAEFTYYLPTGDSKGAKISRFGSYARKLLGVDLSPEVLWNLSPWSWAADWFGNVGDVMHNVSAFGTDGLVMRNGYMMCHSGLHTVDSGTFQGQYQVKTRKQEVKSRLDATPFGFGVVYDGLSLRQQAVIAALGLSRW